MTDSQPMDERTQRHIVYLLLSGFIVFVLSRLVGPMLFENDWSLSQWQHLPMWYWILWLLVTVGVGLWLARRPEALQGIVSHGRSKLIAAVVVLVVLFVLQFNSFVYGGGNLRVAQLAQTEQVLLHWYEFGTLALVSLFYTVMKPISSLIGASTDAMELNQAAVWSWKLLSYLCAMASLAASWLIAKRLTSQQWRRVIVSIILFFGPHALIHFGFVGWSGVFVAVTLWFFYYTLMSLQRRSYLLHVWLVAVVGVALHVSCAYLLPAALYVTMHRMARVKRPLGWPFVVGVVGWVALLGATYLVAGDNLRYVHELLFLQGKRPTINYGLFSLQHLGDLLQVLLIVFPAALVAKFLVARYFLKGTMTVAHGAAMLLTLGGVTLAWITDPSMTIVLDFPTLAAFLVPVSLLAASLLAVDDSVKPAVPSAAGVLAALSVMILLSYLPLHTRIQWADQYAMDYLEENPGYVYSAGLAFRDAYFYIETGDKPRANEWEQYTKRESPIMLLIDGARGLASQGRLSDAVNSLHRLSAEYPYEPEPRLAIANVEMSRGRFDKAQAELDTLLMMYPNNRDVRILDYQMANARGALLTAREKIERALELFPGNSRILVDYARSLVRAGDPELAYVMAGQAVASDSSNAEAWLIYGRLADRRGENDRAIAAYEKFIQMEPRDPEIGKIRKRLNELVMEKRGRSQPN